MGQRSRKRRRPAPADPLAHDRGRAPAVDPPARDRDGASRREAMERRYARARERDDGARAALVPLEPGERPRAVTVAAVFALVVAVANLVAAIASSPSGNQWRLVALQCAVLLIAAIGMWRVKYWAVLGFQVLLGITIVIAFLALLRAGNLWAVLLVVAVITVCSAQFWFLIRAMARIQMPDRAGQARAPDRH